MKELSELKNEFYEVMYKYEKSFSEKGVMADLTAWQTAKADLISLLRRHPDWNEAEQAIIFDCNQALSIQPDIRMLLEIRPFVVADRGEQISGKLVLCRTGFILTIPHNNRPPIHDDFTEKSS